MDEVMFVNIDNIIKDSKLSSIVKMAASSVKSRSYMMPGEFFQSLPDTDLESLSHLCDIIHENRGEIDMDERTREALHNISALTVVLQLGEGKSAFTPEDFTSDLGATIMFVALEKLARHNLVEINRNNFSYIDNDKEIARIAGG